MAPPRSSSPAWGSPDDDDDDYAAAADAHSSPVRPRPAGLSTPVAGARRTRAEYEGDEDHETLDPNEQAVLERYATVKKLRKDDLEEVRAYTTYSPALQRALDFVDRRALSREVAEIKATARAAEFTVPESFKKNGKALGYKMLLKPSATTYKGTVLNSQLLDKLIELGCNLPANVRDDAALMERLRTECGSLLSDCRSALRKALHKSFGVAATAAVPNEDAKKHATLLVLTTTLTHFDRNLKITYEHCARSALMRKVYIKYSEAAEQKDFWGELQKEVARIADIARKSAEKSGEKNKTAVTQGDVAAKTSNIYKDIVRKDRAAHGDVTLDKDGIDELASERANGSGSALAPAASTAGLAIGAAAAAAAAAGADNSEAPEGDEA
uniref:Uncharacterized protein n=1 Tax=Mycena chlorophos TaxID=658473 RepID=A0ABQ0L317_MYCCL|nr:predicted protein [Mycena chlorophos]